MNLDSEYWENRYKSGATGWDIGGPSTPMKEYIDQLTNTAQKILIPGAGNAYEAEYLHQKGFKNIYLIDFSATALANFKRRVPDFPSTHILHGDFFALEDTFDLILEQTFFCALDPKLRPRYAQKMYELLHPAAKVVGLLFNFPLTSEGPPFGGSAQEYRSYFEPYFILLKLEKAYNSISPRAGKELFFKIQKPI